MAHPLDEYPLHQVPMSMRYVASSDRNVYDRNIFQAHDRTGDVMLITGMGVYPNLGVIDAYATLRRGDRQVAVRTSDALADDARLTQTVGPYRLEVVEPLRRLRLVCDADDHGLGFDLTFAATAEPFDEPHHVQRAGDRLIIEGCRFAQVGSWEGVIRVAGEEIAVDPSSWVATRDRSWGIRPVGEAEPAGRFAAEAPTEGFWWNWVPLRFDDFAVMVIAQETADGHRTLHEAIRLWPAATGRPPEQLGWPEFDVRYRPGSRFPEHASIHVTGRDRRALTIEIDTLGFIPLNVGCGYPGDPDWSHGQWKGRGWVDGAVYDHGDDAVAGRAAWSVIDHVARAEFDGAEGWGIFEHGSFGRHTPTGMSGWDSVSP